MPGIVRAEYLSYYNASRNSDKLFNVFLIEEPSGTFSCVTEHGRRGSALVRHTLCTSARRETAENKMREKVNSKRYHRETPYRDEPFGQNYSQIAADYDFAAGADNSGSLPKESQSPQTHPGKSNIIEFPPGKSPKQTEKPKPTGILNRDQFDSLEI